MAIDTIKSTAVLDGAIATADIADDAVTGAKIENNPTIAGNLTVSGNIQKTGDLTVDVAGDIILDADGADVKLSDGGTVYGELTNAASYLRIKNPIQDQDIEFVGNDGGSAITALRFDMSDAGRAVFNAGVSLGGNDAAHTLDDYEEGTWTAAYGSGGSNTGRYTKVGRLVTVNVILNNNGKTFNTVTGLPFAASSATGGGLYSGSLGRIIGMGESRGTVGIGATASYIQVHDDTGGANNLTSGGGIVRMDITITYETDA